MRKTICAALMALALPSAALAAAGDDVNPRGTKWAPLINKCYQGNASYDEACVQHEVLKRGMVDQFGKACYLRDHRAGRGITDAPRIQENLRFMKREGCTEYRTSYEEALRQCAASGSQSCARIAGADSGTTATANSVQGLLGGVTSGNAGNAPAQGADAIGNAIGDAASSLLNGLFK